MKQTIKIHKYLIITGNSSFKPPKPSSILVELSCFAFSSKAREDEVNGECDEYKSELRERCIPQ